MCLLFKFSFFCPNVGTCGENHLYGGLNNTCTDGNMEKIDDFSTCNEVATEMGTTFMNTIENFIILFKPSLNKTIRDSDKTDSE